MSDLDQEELIATRKLNGLDDNLYIDGNDANVGSIEEDIKKVKELNNLLKFFKIHGWIPDMSRELNTNATIEAIEHLLSYYTRQKQINEEHQKVNGELSEKVKELEKENHMFKDNNVLVSRYFKLKDNSIPKQKIKDKIEELKDTLKHYNDYSKLNLLEKVNVD